MIAAGAVSALALAACAPGPSTAAVVNGSPITERQIDEIMAACAAAGYPQQGQEVARHSFVVGALSGEIVATGLLDQELVPDEELVKRFVVAEVGPAGNDPVCGPYIVKNMQMSVAMQEMSQGMSPEQLKDTVLGIFDSIELNPRYGRMKDLGDEGFGLVSGSMSADVQAPAFGR